MATIKDIARVSGVSVATVSRALATPDQLREPTLRKVRDAIQKLNYRPNAAASSLRRQRSDTVIVVVPQISNPFFAGVIKGIENVGHGARLRILLGELQGDQERLDRYAELLLTKQADGMILLGSLLPSIISEEVAAHRPLSIPLVLACERFDGLECSSVQVDNVASSTAATTHLLMQGYRRVATITGPLTNTLGRDRLEGHRHALSLAGVKPTDELIVEGDFSLASGYQRMQELLGLAERPDAVFCANDEMAIGALKAIREAGLRVPEDMGIVGFDNIRFAEYSEPPLSTVAQPALAIGEAAMRLMLSAVTEPPSGFEHIVLPNTLVVRESSQRRSAEVPSGTIASAL